MKSLLISFIFCLAAAQPAIAAISTSEDTRLVPKGNDYEQPVQAAPAKKEQVLLEGDQGRLLYENHCKTCHESAVHIRAKRKAKNYKEVTYWVRQRADWLKLGWTDQEKQQVMQYLNERYYKYPTSQ